MTVGIVLGWIAAAFTLAAFVMKDMYRLRLFAIVANCAFIGYSYQLTLLSTLILHATLLPLNLHRLFQIIKLTKDIQKATLDSPVSEWLLPHMKKRKALAGEILFRIGDTADKMIYVHEGKIKLMEYGDILGPGSLVGEIGLFSLDKRRTQSVSCETDCELYELTDEGMQRLYYQNPKLGFHMMRLIVARLMRDIAVARSTGAATA